MNTRRISQAEQLVGTACGPYRLLSVLGTGTTAAVFEAKHADGTTAALKVSQSGLLDNRMKSTRFLREVQAMKRLRHPATTKLLDWGIESNIAYIAMELVHGEDLAQLLNRVGRLSQREAADMTIAIAEPIAAAHAQGVVHRDLKPKHVKVLSRDPITIKIIDFGLAKLFRGLVDDDQTAAKTLTRAGATLGTPHYMAPEQLNRTDASTDVRVDVYSLGVMLYELVTGSLPYLAPSIVGVLLRLASADYTPPRVHRPDLDDRLERIILRAIAPNANDRYPTVSDLLADLHQLAPALEQEGDSTAIFEARVRDPASGDSSEDTLTRVQQRSQDRVIVRVSQFVEDEPTDGPTVIATVAAHARRPAAQPPKTTLIMRKDAASDDPRADSIDVDERRLRNMIPSVWTLLIGALIVIVAGIAWLSSR